MPLDRTQIPDRSAADFAKLEDINLPIESLNNVKTFAMDKSLPYQDQAKEQTTANDRGIRFWLGATNWVATIWDNTLALFKFVDQAGALQKVQFAPGTASTHGITKAQLDAAIAALQLEVTGSIKLFSGTTAPAGYLLCDGTAQSRTTYATLFALIGTNFGAGNGTSTFNVPDLRGRFPLGLDNMGGTPASRVIAAAASILGGSGGVEEVTLSISQIPAIQLRIPFNITPSSTTAPAGSANSTVTSNTGGTGVQTNSVGGGGSHTNMPPWVALNYIIKT